MAPPAPAPAHNLWLLETLPKPWAISIKWEQNLAALEKQPQMASASLESQPLDMKCLLTQFEGLFTVESDKAPEP